jgi:probable phosphoglycerate mutase
MTRLVLVRHGESNATVQRIVGGPRSCTGLSDLGRRQASALAERLGRTGEVRADVLIASTYPRAIETAELLAPALGGLTVQQVYEVGEHFPGPESDGMTFEEYSARYGLTDWNGNPYDVGFPGGETIAEFQHRVNGALSSIARQHAGKNIVVVCHGGVIDTAVRRFLQAPPTGLFEIYTVNTSITEFALAGANKWRMIRYNDAAHLAGLPADSPRVHRPASDADRLELREITAGNLDEVCKIEVWPNQRKFVGSVTDSLLDAHHQGTHAWYRAAYIGDRPIGFVMLALPGQADDEFPHDAWFLWRLLVGGPFQRGGYGRRLLELVCAEVASRPDTPHDLYTSWIGEPDGPGGFYERFGFEPTGELLHGEVVGRLERWPAEPAAPLSSVEHSLAVEHGVAVESGVPAVPEPVPAMVRVASPGEV